MPELNLTEITAALKKEISIITGKKAEDLKETESLSFNGINSMGFVELLLTINRLWGINLLEAGISISDVVSISALAEKIKQEAAR